jgi:hypothetical protein
MANIFDRDGNEVAWGVKSPKLPERNPEPTTLSPDIPVPDIASLMDLGLPVRMSSMQALAVSKFLADRDDVAASDKRESIDFVPSGRSAPAVRHPVATDDPTLAGRVEEARKALYGRRDDELARRSSALLAAMRAPR